jgi:hypothetical protein
VRRLHLLPPIDFIREAHQLVVTVTGEKSASEGSAREAAQLRQGLIATLNRGNAFANRTLACHAEVLPPSVAAEIQGSLE